MWHQLWIGLWLPEQVIWGCKRLWSFENSSQLRTDKSKKTPSGINCIAHASSELNWSSPNSSVTGTKLFEHVKDYGRLRTLPGFAVIYPKHIIWYKFYSWCLFSSELASGRSFSASAETWSAHGKPMSV